MDQQRIRGPLVAPALRLALTLALLLGLAGPLTPLARAATRTVGNTNDSGPGSLRQAIADAQPGDEITCAVTGTITLTGGELVVGKILTVSEPGADRLTISGKNASRVFSVPAGVTAGIAGVTITGG